MVSQHLGYIYFPKCKMNSGPRKPVFVVMSKTYARCERRFCLCGHTHVGCFQMNFFVEVCLFLNMNREYRKKENILFNDNGTVSYIERKWYKLMHNMSVGYDNETFTTINIPVVVSMPLCWYSFVIMLCYVMCYVIVCNQWQP